MLCFAQHDMTGRLLRYCLSSIPLSGSRLLATDVALQEPVDVRQHPPPLIAIRGILLPSTICHSEIPHAAYRHYL